MSEELPGMLAVAKGIAEQQWPHTMDAAVWATEFKKTFPDIDEGTMIGWFANAIMAGYDTAQARSASTAATSLLEERIACAKAMCPSCREGNYPDHQSDPTPTYWHDATRCRANEIWLRGKPSDPLGAYIEERTAAPASAGTSRTAQQRAQLADAQSVMASAGEWARRQMDGGRDHGDAFDMVHRLMHSLRDVYAIALQEAVAAAATAPQHVTVEYVMGQLHKDVDDAVDGLPSIWRPGFRSRFERLLRKAIGLSAMSPTGTLRKDGA